MDEKLKEFVDKSGLLISAGGETYREQMHNFAQAVAAFTEKRVLEELRNWSYNVGFRLFQEDVKKT